MKPKKAHRGKRRERGANPLRYALPPLLAVVLAIPCMRWPWLWDDYHFLGAAQTFQLHDLLSRGDVLFWRPISRELWFAFLWHLTPHSPLWGHMLNAILVAVAIVLVGSVASRLFGAAAGFLTATLYASLGALPMLIGWASASQDLLGIIFFLAALHFRLSGRLVLSLVATALAMLSKETTSFLVPLLAATPWIVDKGPRRAALELGSYAALLTVWVAAHAGIHALLARRFAGGGSEVYIGLGGLERLLVLGRLLLMPFNIPVPGAGSAWQEGRTVLLLGAAALLIVGVGIAYPRVPLGPAGDRPRLWRSRSAVLAAGLVLLPTVGIAALLKVWSPYYTVLPAIGTTMLLGAALARARTKAAVLAGTTLFMILGMALRAQPFEHGLPTELNAEVVSRAMERVERGFKTLRPALPRGTHLLVSTPGLGTLQIDTHIHYLQAPRVWYGDPKIRVLRPNLRVRGNHPELLFRITPNLDVIEIDPNDGSYHTTGDLPDMTEITRPLRSYARALAATGEADRGIAIFRNLEEVAQGNLKIVDRRYAVMVLLASGRREEAARAAEGIPDIPHDIALDIIAKLYLDAVPDTAMEEASFPAFGVDPRDLEANRYIMRRLNREGSLKAALRLARRVQAIAPGDAESRALIQDLLNRPARDLALVPVAGDSL